MYSIVIPVYNSSKSLWELYNRTNDVFQTTIKESFEFVFVDDSSKDNSYEVLKEIRKQDLEHVKIIQLAKNYGQHCALLCGFKYAKGDYIITLDDDLQHPPEEIPKLIARLKSDEDHIDVVMGQYNVKKHNFIRNLGSDLVNRLSGKIFGLPNNFKFTSFRLMKKYVADAMVEEFDVNYPRVGYLLVEVTNHIENVIVEHSDRKYGSSGYTLSHLVRDFCKNIITNSILPLTIVQNIGLFSFILSILFGIYYLGKYILVGISIKGWTTLILLLLMYSGLILFAIGIIGQYLIQILNEAKKSPNYVVRKKHL